MALSNIFSRYFSKRDKFEDNSPVGQPVVGIQSFVPNYSETGKYITPELARSSPSVYACMLLISQSIARMEWRVISVKSNGETQNLTAHPLYRMLNVEVNSEMGALTWKQSLVADCLLYGNAYSYIERDQTGRPIALEKLRPDMMMLERAEDNSVKYKYSTGLPAARDFEGYDIFHLIGPSQDGLLGEPPIHLARQMIGMEIEAESFCANFFANGARPAGVLQVQGTMSPEAMQRLRTSWQDVQGGARNSGRVAVLESGYEFKQISINPDDAQLIELRRYCREQIAAAFGVPPHMIGETAKQSYSSAEQADIEFTKHTLGSWAARLEEEATRKLLRPGEQIKTQISFDALTRGDQGGRFNSYATALQHGFMTINEIRSREMLNPINGGDFIRAPLNLGPLSATLDSAPAGAEATASGIGQIQAFQTIAQSITESKLTPEKAKAILIGAFPLLHQQIIDEIIQPAAPVEPEAAPVAAPVAGAATPAQPEATAPTDEIAKTALNGAQISSMISIIEKVTDGTLPKGSAQAIISAAFPTIPTATISAILQPLVEGSKKNLTQTPPQQKAPPQPNQAPPNESRDCGTGSGGFQPGNSCQGGEGGNGSNTDPGDGIGGILDRDDFQNFADTYDGGTTFNSDLGIHVPNNPAKIREMHQDMAKKMAEQIGELKSDNTSSMKNSAQSADELIADSESVVTEFKSMLNEAAQETGGEPNYGPGGKHALKLPPAIKDKIERIMKRDECDEPAAIQTLNDTVRGSILFDDATNLGNAARSFADSVREKGGTVAFSNKFTENMESGYCAVHAEVMLKTPQGNMIKSEVQFHIKTIHDGSARSVKEQAHKPYVKARAVTADPSLVKLANQGMMLQYATALMAALEP